MNELFHQVAVRVSAVTGSPWVFVGAVIIIAVWAATGPVFHFSDTWQLVINTGTTVVTFLMVFLIQNTQNRDTKAINIKLDELLRGVSGARTGMVDIEDISDDQLESLHMEFKRLHEKYASELARRKKS